MSWWPPRPIEGAGPTGGELARVVVAPSILAARMERLAEEVAAVERAGADILHLDVMDGHFVPNISFGPSVVAGIRRTTGLPLDTHLMISEPERYLDAFREAGSDSISVHLEAVPDPREVSGRVRGAGARFGLALNPETPLKRAVPFLGDVDILLLMSVAPGFGGQTFRPEVLGKVEGARRLRRERGHAFLIEIDGGVGPGTAPGAVAAGADILVAGSSIFGGGDYREAILALRASAAG